MLPHRAYIEILFRIVEHILWQKGIVLLFLFHLCVEHVVLYIRYHPAIKHIFVVLLTAITGVCYNLRALSAVSVAE